MRFIGGSNAIFQMRYLAIVIREQPQLVPEHAGTGIAIDRIEQSEPAVGHRRDGEVMIEQATGLVRCVVAGIDQQATQDVKVKWQLVELQ